MFTKRKKHKELSVRARKRGVFWVINGLFNSVSQTSLVFVTVFVGLLWCVNFVTDYLGPNQTFKVARVQLFPADDPDVQKLRPILNVHEGDVCNNLDFNSLEGALKTESWIDKVEFKLEDHQVLHVNFKRKIPLARMRFIDINDSLKSQSIVLVDSTFEIFKPSSEAHLERYSHLPLIDHYGPEPKQIQGFPLSRHVESIVQFIVNYEKTRVAHKFGIESITIADQTFFVQLQGDIKLNLINPKPVMLVDAVENILSKIPINELRKNLIYIRNPNDIFMKNRDLLASMTMPAN